MKTELLEKRKRCAYPNGIQTGHVVLRLPEALVGSIRVASPGDGWVSLDVGRTWAREVDGRCELLRVDAVFPDGVRAAARATFDAAQLPAAVLAATAEAVGVFEAPWTSLAADDPLLVYAVQVLALKDAVWAEVAPALSGVLAHRELWFAGPAGPADQESGFSFHIQHGWNGQLVIDAIAAVADRNGWPPLIACPGCGGPDRAGGPHRRAGVGAALASIGLDGAPLAAVKKAVADEEQPPF